MKYQAGLESTKEFLKTNPAPVIREICETAGLSEKETEIILLKYRLGKQRLYTSEKVCRCETAVSKKTTLLLKIIKKTLILIGAIDDTF